MLTKVIPTAYGEFTLTVKQSGDRHAELFANGQRIYNGTLAKVTKTFEGTTSGRLVNMLKNAGVIRE